MTNRLVHILYNNCGEILGVFAAFNRAAENAEQFNGNLYIESLRML